MPNKLLLAAARKPSIRKFITHHRVTKAVADRFVAGDMLEEGLAAAKRLNGLGIGGILDYLGENVTNESQADSAMHAYLESLDAISSQHIDAHVSVKLTQLGLDIGAEGCMRRLETLCAKATEVGTRLAIDMESHEYTQSTIDAYRRVRISHGNVVLCLQAYLRRTVEDVRSLLDLDPAIRLCKGAYDEPRDIAHRGEWIQAAFIESLEVLLDNASYTAVATHDDVLISAAKSMGSELGRSRERFEFQMLYGVRQQLQQDLVAEGYSVRTYIPFGDQWYPYLMRRLAERPANLRFFAEALVRG